MYITERSQMYEVLDNMALDPECGGKSTVSNFPATFIRRSNGNRKREILPCIHTHSFAAVGPKYVTKGLHFL